MAHQLLRPSTLILIFAIIIYVSISKVIFDQIYLTSPIIVDEEFHLPLGEAYCNYDFNTWDPKVTTFPGLYLLSALIFGKFQLCSTYWLRFVSFLASCVNIILFYMLLNLHNKDVPWKNVISAINLSMLPPLYFFSHVYYTDVSSIMMTMLMFISAKKKYHFLASIFGAMAIMMRQTNVIWIGMLFGDYILQEFYSNTLEGSMYWKKVRIPLKGVQDVMSHIITHPVAVIKKTNFQFVLNCSAYMSVFCSFLVFVYLNGSIVVGDKTAHSATIHFPQLFYFATFTLLFCWPHFLNCIIPFCKFAYRNKLLIVIMALLCLCAVHFNTLIHPYMLADNRHYTFYVWNRFYGKYIIFRYAIVLVYIFAMYGILSKIWDNDDISFPLMYILCSTPLLVMQKLIEVRYFLFPFILFRIQLRKPSTSVLLLENVSYMVVNAVTLYTFFTKSIIWENYDYPQKLIW